MCLVTPFVEWHDFDLKENPGKEQSSGFYFYTSHSY